jgi:hypothetical protein
MFLSNEDREAFEAVLNTTNKGTIQNIAALVESRVIEKMLQSGDTPSEFKIERLPKPTERCPYEDRPGEHIIIGTWCRINHSYNTPSNYQNLCRCGYYYETGPNSIQPSMLECVTGAPDWILWFIGAQFRQYGHVDQSFIKFLRVQHCKSVSLEKKLQELKEEIVSKDKATIDVDAGLQDYVQHLEKECTELDEGLKSKGWIDTDSRCVSSRTAKKSSSS